MTPFIVNLLCDPVSKGPLVLTVDELDSRGNIKSGILTTLDGRRYPIIEGIPRFNRTISPESVKSFGDEWNYFNFVDFKNNWLQHTVRNTFGTTDVFKDKIIVDAGGGSGAQSRWFVEYGAKHVILLELSESVDDVVLRNVGNFDNVDVIQCSIDEPPIKAGSIDGMVYCHNVIQHTRSVEVTARALFSLVAEGGEFIFNCYPLNNEGFFRWARFNFVYSPLRFLLSKMPFSVILFYSRILAVCRIIPVLGKLLELSGFCVQGDVPVVPDEKIWARILRRFHVTVLNTFDCFGSHEFQHLKKDSEIRALIFNLQPDPRKIKNMDAYFSRPTPIGCALRIFR